MTTSTGAAEVVAAQGPGTSDADVDRTIAIGHGALLQAIRQNMAENSVKVQVAGVGAVRLPGLDQLAWLGGLAVLAAVGVLEWPVAAVVGTGHVLAHQRHLRLLRDFGEALERS